MGRFSKSQSLARIPPINPRMRFILIAAAFGSMVCSGESLTSEPRQGSGEVGIASWYGYPYHGRTAADGTIYDMEQSTAAHRTLPLGTWVRVTNLQNRTFVDVRITDRGPFVDGRIIDLSRAAARTIDVLDRGLAPVRVDIIDPPLISRASPVTGSAFYAVQVGAFQEKNHADRLRTQLEKQYQFAAVVPRPGTPVMWRVFVGREASSSQATALADRLRAELGAAFVARVNEPAVQPAAETP